MNKGNNLIGHNKTFTNLVKLYNDNKLPNKILLSGNRGIGKHLFSSHFVNYILSQDEKFKYDEKNFQVNSENNSYLLFQNNIHPNIFLVSKHEDKKNIEISQIREMIKFQNNSSFNNKLRFIIIDNAHNLNLNSSNALLKSIEEPNNKVFYILTYNTCSKLQDTIRSRCIEFKLFLNYSSVKSIVNNYFSENIFDSIQNDFINYYHNPSFVISLIQYLNEKSFDIKNINIENLIYFIIDNKEYVKNMFIKDNIMYLIELFFYKKVSYTNQKIYKLKKYFYYKFNQLQKYNLDLESFFLEFQQKLLSE